MSDFSWRHGITAGLTLIIAFAIGGYILGHQLGHEVGKKDAHTKEYERHAANEIERTCLRLDPAAEAECVVRVINSAHEQKRAESDLIAQRNMARWALLMLLATIAMTFITAAGAYYVWRTLKATQEIARDTARIGEAQTRAYVHVSGAELSWGGPNAEAPSIALTVENVGQTPAKWFEIRKIAFVQNLGPEGQPIEKLKFLRDEIAAVKGARWPSIANIKTCEALRDAEARVIAGAIKKT